MRALGWRRTTQRDRTEDQKQIPKKVRPLSDAATDGDRWGA